MGSKIEKRVSKWYTLTISEGIPFFVLLKNILALQGNEEKPWHTKN